MDIYLEFTVSFVCAFLKLFYCSRAHLIPLYRQQELATILFGNNDTNTLSPRFNGKLTHLRRLFNPAEVDTQSSNVNQCLAETPLPDT